MSFGRNAPPSGNGYSEKEEVASQHAFRTRRRTLRAMTRSLAGVLCRVYVPDFLKKIVLWGEKKGGLNRT